MGRLQSAFEEHYSS